MPRITALNIYPVKSCRGIPLERARIVATGFEHDREWLIVQPNGRFVTQREEPRLSLIETALDEHALQLRAPGLEPLRLSLSAEGAATQVSCWNDTCTAFDLGAAPAEWLSHFLGKSLRMVRFDPRSRRTTGLPWTGGKNAPVQFSDAFQWLLISQASLDDLNARLAQPLPMNRFRPNIVVEGLPAYGEDRVHEYLREGIRLRTAKPCTRCVITTTDQLSGRRDGQEPLRTLKGYRYSRELKGVMFGQNLMLVAGAGRELRVGDRFETSWKTSGPARAPVDAAPG